MQTEVSIGKTRVEWNPLNKKEVDEAKQQYLQARKLNRSICGLDHNPIERFSASSGGFIIGDTCLGDSEISVRLVNETGDERLVWNVNDSKQVSESAKRFQGYLDKGWKAYCIREDGSRGQRIYGFDANTEEVIFDDKTTREKLKNFAKKFKKVELLPRTFPG